MKNVFVMGTNELGKHGAGAAKYAMEHHGAVYGKGEGLQGNSYGIPTKDGNFKPLPLNSINEYVRRFIQFARRNNDQNYNITRIGCGLAGYTDEQIAPFFRSIPKANCFLPLEWKSILGEEYQYHDLKG